MHDSVTILGRVGNDPTTASTAGGYAVTNFRVASPQRRFDSKTQQWIETGTNWYSVAAFRQLGEHAKRSLHCGDAVIITGRLKVREWESNGRKGTSIDIDAEAIGHDLRWGTSAYARATRSTEHPAVEPAAESAEQREVAEEDPFAPRSADEWAPAIAS